jgi:cell division protease FtsH
VHKISIVPRGKALGYTMNLPEEDRYLKTKEELVDHLKVLFGGRIAEDIVFGRVTTGAVDDLRRVTELSRAMIEEYGMGSQMIVRGDGSSSSSLSEETLNRRDRDQQALIDEAQFEARCLIADHRDLLDKLANSLLENEVLDRAEVDRIMGALAAPRLHVAEAPAPAAGETAGEVAEDEVRESIAPPHGPRFERTNEDQRSLPPAASA